MNLSAFLAVFSLIFLAELGDKTQLAVISLCARCDWRAVFSGAMGAFILIDGLSVIVGQAVSEVAPTFWIQAVGGIMFLAFGIYPLLKNEREDEGLKFSNKGSTVASAFTFISLAELGDKTQLAVIALAADYGDPLTVFLGVVFAFAAITLLGVFIGKGLVRFIPQRFLKLFSSALFVAFGVFFLLQLVLST